MEFQTKATVILPLQIYFKLTQNQDYLNLRIFDIHPLVHIHSDLHLYHLIPK
jgi:hypothetical protein